MRYSNCDMRYAICVSICLYRISAFAYHRFPLSHLPFLWSNLRPRPIEPLLVGKLLARPAGPPPPLNSFLTPKRQAPLSKFPTLAPAGPPFPSRPSAGANALARFLAFQPSQFFSASLKPEGATN
ncbi:uncharacterized protein VTP21DRAFT_7407 [Calcarisporiella thermophila]|uniref:uncharacterized protein n=1 Tax=Calcarisporiella thermophila TaxID=911321 RepID=UPI00374396A9